MIRSFSCVVFCVIASFAVATEYPDPIPLSGGEVRTINVASGTDTYTGAITGEGSIKKTGSGTLDLACEDNTFDGGIEVNGGTLKATKSGAFGSGDVGCSASTSISFAAPDGVFDNNFGRPGTVSKTSYARFTWYFVENTTLNGNLDLPAPAAHQLVTTKQGTGAADSSLMVWNGTVTCPNSMYWEYLYGTYEFHGPLLVGTFRPGTADASGVCGRVKLYSDENVIQTFEVNNTEVVCCNENVLGGAKLTVQGGGSGCLGGYNLNGKDQTVSALGIYDAFSARITKAFWGAAVTSESDPATLTITGRGEGLCDTNNLAVNGHVAVTLDAPGYRQVCTLRQHGTDGRLWIKNGALELIDETSFKNVPEIEVDADGEVLVNSTTPGLFGSATNVVMDGVFTCLEGVSDPFPTNVVIALSDDSSLTFPAAATIKVKALTLNGTPLRGEISAGDARLPQLKGGTIVVQGADVETSDVWTGKAGDASIGAGANWQSGEQPDFTSGKFAATFAAADAESFAALVDCNVRFRGLTFSTLVGFTFLPDASTRIFDVGAEGVTVADAEEGHAPVYAFDVPVNFKAAQVWDIGTGATLRVAGGTAPIVTEGSKSVAVIEKKGEGLLEIGGENAWDGQVTVREGDVLVNGKITTSSGPDSIQITGGNDATMFEADNAFYLHLDAGYTLSLSNAVIEKATMVKFADDASYRPSRALSGSTNYFNAFFRTADASRQTMRLDSDSVVVFAGGGRFNYAFGIKGTGTAIFRNKTFTAPNGTSGFYVNGGAHAVFETSGNTLKALSMGVSGEPGGTLDLKADDVVTAAGRPLIVNSASTVNVFGTVQHFTSIAATGLELTGEEGSWIVVTNLEATASTMAKSFLSGAVSYCHAAAGTMTFSKADSTSTGTLEVRDGSVVFAADATWATVSNVVVTGTGKLVINGKAFGKKAPKLVLDGDGVLSVPSGVTQRFARAFVGAEELPLGRYTYANAPAALKDHLDPAAGGTVAVVGENPGVLLIVR